MGIPSDTHSTIYGHISRATPYLGIYNVTHSISGISPLVVHCSAGLGRTGCFIAVDIGIQALRQDEVVDVLKIVASMRLDR